jgi:hypothetical protein
VQELAPISEVRASEAHPVLGAKHKHYTKCRFCGIFCFMKKTADAYILAAHIHNSFLGINDILTPEELLDSGVTVRTGSTSSNTSQRIETIGELDEVPVHQTVALDGLDRYHLSTVDLRYGGKHTQTVIMPESPVENLSVIANTLFMHKLVEIAQARSS